jgi:hypothetical protein
MAKPMEDRLAGVTSGEIEIRALDPSEECRDGSIPSVIAA